MSRACNNGCDTQKHSCARAVKISAKIEGEVWKVLRHAEKCNGAYYCDKQRCAACGISVSVRIPLPMSGYVREQTTSLPMWKCLRRRDEEAFGKRLRSAARGFLFLEFFRAPFPPLPLARSVRAVWFFPPRNRSPVTLSPFVSHAKALITSFRVGRWSRSY